MKKTLAALASLPAAAALVLFLLSTGAAIKVEPAVKAVGLATPVEAVLSNPHGVRRFRAILEQDGARQTVFEEARPAARFLFWRTSEAPRTVRFTVGKKHFPALKDGKARLILEAQSNDFRGASTSLVFDVDVATRPPAVTADGFQHYINHGGSELVVFSVSGDWTEAGVRAGKYRFRSFPLPGDSSKRFAIFAYPWDLPPGEVPLVYAKDSAGNETTSRFWFKLFPKKFRKRDLELPDSFIAKVVNEIDPGGPGDRLARFLKINGEMRCANNRTLADLRLKTEERLLWSGPFLQLANSKVESLFADTRNYLYKGRKVDEQTHLGFDLSVVKNVPVLASNGGKVIFAERLGIYGNCVVVDHGYGLQSIYAHLNEIGVKPGDTVKKSQQLGRSGATGLAGGDHLHFSMQVDGVQVNPVEWWDGHWIQDRILSKLPEKGV